MTLVPRLVSSFRDEGGHLRALTGIRGWAAFWVFLYHSWVFSVPRQLVLPFGTYSLDMTPFVRMGGAGVSIFFVLSGFLLALPFAEWQAGRRQPPNLRRYFSHRVLRVFPAYYAQLALLMVIAFLIPGQPGIADWPTFMRHLGMLFTPPPIGTKPINLVWWTLPIEFSFYLILPALAFMLRPQRWAWLLAGSLAAMWLWRLAAVTWLHDASVQERVVAAYQLPGSMDMFGFGMLGALLHANRSRIPGWIYPGQRQDRLAVLGLLLVIVAIYWLYYEHRQYWSDNPIFYLWTPALSLGILGLILSAAGGARLVNALFGNRLMVFAGIVSYSVYLWHVPILYWVNSLAWVHDAPGYRLPWLLMIALPLLYVVASVSYLLVERPFMRIRGK
jgi:peptidoglycan/LPS O-acetylase OafA/YrhL